MTASARRALTVACAAGLALPAAALAATPTIRVEGAEATLLPETPRAASASPVTVRDASDADTVTVPGDSATAQLAGAAAAAGLPLGFSVFDFGGPASFITRIGPEAMPAGGSPSWRLTVNHVAAQVGADAVTIAEGDRALWALVPDFEARELDVAVSSDLVAVGTPVEVGVTSHAVDGTARPAAGATVTFAGLTRTAGPTGRVTFPAAAAGSAVVLATAPGEVRSPARRVCAVAGDPSACGQPVAGGGAAGRPPAGRGPPAGGAAALPDTVAPGSRITSPRFGARLRSVRGITGVAGPDRSDVARVEVALARRVGTQCRFLDARGRLGSPAACTARVWLRARSAGGNWAYAPRRPLTAGVWRVWSRATDGAGNVASTGIARASTGQFTIGARR
jgi:hypothetical protein